MAARDSNGRFVSGGGGAKATVTVRDTGLAALLGRLEAAAKDIVLSVGVHEEDGVGMHNKEGKPGPTVMQVAEIQEFGLGVPPVAMVGSTADELNGGQHQHNTRKLGEALVKGTLADPVTGMKQLGEKYVGMVQMRTPIDTGILRSSIAARVA